MNIEHEETMGVNRSQRDPSRPGQQPRSNRGRYLKEKTPTARRSRKRRRKLNRNFLIAVVVGAIILGAILGISIALIVNHFSKPDITGRWDVDGVTAYEFEENGKGTLVLSLRQYEFDYSIDGDVLTITFPEGVGHEAKYTFDVNGNYMYWTGGPGDARTEYILTKVE